MSHWRRASLAVAALLCAASTVAGALDLRRVVRLCNATEAAGLQQLRVPIGCDVIGRNTGCPLGARLQLQLEVELPMDMKIAAQVQSVPPAAGQSLQWSGEVEPQNKGRRLLRAGETRITGVTTSASPAPTLLLEVDGRNLSVRRASLDPDGSLTAVIKVAQWVGDVRVARALARVQFRNCPQTLPQESSDRLVLVQNDSGREAIALINGRRGAACVRSERRFGMGSIALGNMRSPTPCAASRATIFTMTRAVDFAINTSAHPDTLAWTVANGEVVSRTLGKPVVQPVKVWFLSTTQTLQRAHAMMALAENASVASFSGIRFDFAGPTDLSTDTRRAVVDAREVNCTASTLAAETLPKLKAVRTLSGSAIAGPSDPPFNKRLDVFFVDHAGGANGSWCGWATLAGENFLLVAPGGNDVVLAHELGHALMNSGDHANDAAFSPNNLMRTGAYGRYLTIGQVFRTSLEPQGAVNRLHVRSGDTAACPEFGSSSSCPRAACDVDRNADPLLLPTGEAMPCVP